MTVEIDPAIIAVDVEGVKLAIGPALRQLYQTGTSNLGIMIALAQLGAHHGWHDGATRDDFLRIARIAWQMTAEDHAGENAEALVCVIPTENSPSKEYK